MTAIDFLVWMDSPLRQPIDGLELVARGSVSVSNGGARRRHLGISLCG